MKHYVFFILLLLGIVNLHNCEANARSRPNRYTEAEKKFAQYLNGQIRLNDKSLRVPKRQVLWEGWIKYFHYDTVNHNKGKPNAFFINNDYFNQVVLSKEIGLKDTKGYLNIPTRFHFYAKLMKNGLNIMSARQSDHILHTVDTLSLDLILPVFEDKRLKGGVKDLGDFDEGKCIQVDAKIPAFFNQYFYSGTDKGMNEHWIICTDDSQPKVNLMNMLVRLRILKQKSLGIREKSNVTQRIRGRQTMTTLKLSNKDKGIERYYGPGHNIHKDGYWILINDWSQCTLKCGGGKSYQQWMCIPPKRGGKNCVGSSIRVRPCNSQPCPGQVGTEDERC